MFEWLSKIARDLRHFLARLTARIFRRPLDLLGGAAVRPTRVGGPVGRSPVVKPSPARTELTSFRAQKLARKAAISLFEEYELAFVPGQFWSFLEAAGFDPANAFHDFLLAIGCDVELFRRRDPKVISNVRSIIDLLVQMGDVLASVDPALRAYLSEQLRTGDFAKVSALAEILANLRAARDAAVKWRGKPIMAVFEELVGVLDKLFANPMHTSISETADVADLVHRYSQAQTNLDHYVSTFRETVFELNANWPATWVGTDREHVRKEHIATFEKAASRMLASKRLSIENIEDGIALLGEKIEALVILLQETKGAAGAGDPKSKRSPGPPPDEIDEALRYFGFSKINLPTRDQIYNLWRKRASLLHPDRHPSEEFDRVNAQMAELNMMHQRLTTHFGWRRRAAA